MLFVIFLVLFIIFSTHQCQQWNLTVTNITNTTVAVTWNEQDSNMYHVSYWEVNGNTNALLDDTNEVSFLLYCPYSIDDTN